MSPRTKAVADWAAQILQQQSGRRWVGARHWKGGRPEESAYEFYVQEIEKIYQEKIY